MTSFTISLPGDISITVSCEESDIREVVSEILMGLKDYADECNDQKKKDERYKKINLYFPGQEFSVTCRDYKNATKIVRKLCDDINEYSVVTVCDLKDYFGMSTDIQDTHYGVNQKRDIVITPCFEGCVITLKNLIEVY